MKVGVISLGCSKNLVDSEVLLGKLRNAGVNLTGDIEEADLVIINTCGFIEDAKRESIDTILEVAEKGKRLIVMGCLSQRYMDALKEEIPEVEAFFGTQSWNEIMEYLGLSSNRGPSIRVLATPRSYAYLKIAEGCNRLRSFCAIPKIRGRHVSRSIEEITEEARYLADLGVREIIIISQDTTYYGRDLYGKSALIELLRKLEKIEPVRWIRLLYLYPTEVSDELISLIADSEKIVPYFDIPIQHISDRVLKSMRRGYDERFIRGLIDKIRSKVVEPVLRTTLIVGYPAEGEDDFRRLREFVSEGNFHWLGVFKYSPEEGTPAENLGDPVADDVKNQRFMEILEIQKEITSNWNRSLVGRDFEVIVEGYDEEFSFVPKGRAYIHAPEVDGCVYIEADNSQLKTGDIINVRIEQASEYDLLGKISPSN